MLLRFVHPDGRLLLEVNRDVIPLPGEQQLFCGPAGHAVSFYVRDVQWLWPVMEDPQTHAGSYTLQYWQGGIVQVTLQWPTGAQRYLETLDT